MEEYGMDLPPKQAKSDRIRLYISHTLVSHGMTESRAVELASQWTLGTGLDLRSCSSEVLRATFGDLPGWVLSQDVQAFVHSEQNALSLSNNTKCNSMSFWEKTISGELIVSL